ncbi:hypothetical protein HYT23_00820 [Candidatus Pacearchaeota archaeon]|nr:hypothetical protein [Candidatus Pacearchaeota archaeon]
MKVTAYEKRNYALSDKEYFVILAKIKNVEKHELSRNDKEIVNLIRTQLKKNWRLPLISYLNKITLKYKK